ncbi:hypothetical protein Vadar_008509 [Vaccinium darrowii]|uniref:Uncharacterized protein n=1 Tax=Vaccinium darrowii TaxID=229202 RepID=A0ACB7Z3G2_9ERIC|nr:hypothetical protein Vadar_008509 [Vaccinium darrowii]
MESQSPVQSQLEEETQRKTRKARKLNYIPAEDEALVKAWLHISGDAVIDEAKQQFGEIEGPLQTKPVPFYKFKFEHCWKILKDSPKWNDHVLIRNTSKVSKKPSNPQSQAIDSDDQGSPPSFTPSTPCPTLLDEVISLDHGHDEVRAVGKKKTKAKRKNEGKDDESTLYLKNINERLEEATKIEKEKLEVKKSSEKEKWAAKKRRIEQKEMQEERKVMSQSLVGLSPDQEAYWKLQQSLIVSRYKANGFIVNKETCGNDFDFNF